MFDDFSLLFHSIPFFYTILRYVKISPINPIRSDSSFTNTFLYCFTPFIRRVRLSDRSRFWTQSSDRLNKPLIVPPVTSTLSHLLPLSSSSVSVSSCSLIPSLGTTHSRKCMYCFWKCDPLCSLYSFSHCTIEYRLV